MSFILCPLTESACETGRSATHCEADTQLGVHIVTPHFKMKKENNELGNRKEKKIIIMKKK